MEMRRGFQNAHSAYQRVMFRRTDPAAEPVPEEIGESQKGRGAARKWSDFEKEALFQEWVKKWLGTNPDKMDDEAYSRPSWPLNPTCFARRSRSRARHNSSTSGRTYTVLARTNRGGRQTREGRRAGIYRRLVRRLQPDLQADGSAAVSALWHEVQETDAANDVAQMEILLALSNIEARRRADQSLSQMRALLAELERPLRALEKSLLETEGEDARDFARIGPRSDLRLRVERELESGLAERMRRLDLLTRTIAEWA